MEEDTTSITGICKVFRYHVIPLSTYITPLPHHYLPCTLLEKISNTIVNYLYIFSLSINTSFNMFFRSLSWYHSLFFLSSGLWVFSFHCFVLYNRSRNLFPLTSAPYLFYSLPHPLSPSYSHLFSFSFFFSHHNIIFSCILIMKRNLIATLLSHAE